MEDNIVIREYKLGDKDSVLDLIRLNIPQSFAEEELSDFSQYLDNERELYYVLLVDQKIVGCGGLNFAENHSVGKISWDIVHPEYQGKSLGRELLLYRINELKSMKSIQKITVRTSQVAYLFYEKHGFKLLEIKKDFWAKGFDMYSMAYKK